MIITTYNDHVKAPSFPVVLCLQTKNTVSDRAFAFIQSTLARFLRGWGCSTPAIRGCIFKSYACLFLLRAKESHLIACTRCGRTATEAVGIVVGIGVRVVTLGVNQIGVVRGSRRTRPADI